MKLDYEKIKKIADKYGDSFYLFDSTELSNNYCELLRSFKKIYPKTEIAYSYKTNYTPRICRIVNSLGGSAEIVSEMELWLALHVGVGGSKIYYNGPYKKEKYIEELMLKGGHVNVDAEYEIELIEKIAKRHRDTSFSVGVRCNIDIGQDIPSRFGFDVSSGELEEAVKKINSIANIHVNGLHCHIPYRDPKTYVSRMTALSDILKKFPEYSWDYISLGGGYMGKVSEQLAVQMTFAPPTFDDYANIIADGMNNLFNDKDNRPTLIIEPGSALVADTFKYVTKVINIKRARDKIVVGLTGSTYQMNPSVKSTRRPITVYHSEALHDIEEYQHIDMAGYTCIESDYLYKDYCGGIAVDDYVVFDNVGSYSVVMKPPFILPDIPILEIDDQDKIGCIKRAQDSKDVFKDFI